MPGASRLYPPSVVQLTHLHSILLLLRRSLRDPGPTYSQPLPCFDHGRTHDIQCWLLAAGLMARICTRDAPNPSPWVAVFFFLLSNPGRPQKHVVEGWRPDASSACLDPICTGRRHRRLYPTPTGHLPRHLSFVALPYLLLRLNGDPSARPP